MGGYSASSIRIRRSARVRALVGVSLPQIRVARRRSRACEEVFKQVRDKAGDDRPTTAAKCIADSDSCAGAARLRRRRAGKSRRGTVRSSSKERRESVRRRQEMRQGLVFGSPALVSRHDAAASVIASCIPPKSAVRQVVELCKPPTPSGDERVQRAIEGHLDRLGGRSSADRHCMVGRAELQRIALVHLHADRRANALKK